VLDETHVAFESEGLRIEGALHTGDGKLAAVVLHPHPQYGGDMDSHVVTTLCRTLAEAGATTLRFNFRGAGASEGAYDGGPGEAADARAAIDYVRGRAPGAALVLSGYSFGAAIAAGIAADISAVALVLVSLPAQAPGVLPAGVATLIVTGDADAIAPAEELRQLEAPGRPVVVVDGVDHFWFPGADRLAAAVAGFLRNLQSGG
jgi:alpha/beta superfamily hydrolase